MFGAINKTPPTVKHPNNPPSQSKAKRLSPTSMSSEREGLIAPSDQPPSSPPNDDTPKHFPRHVGFILGNEFCERFSFYGMRTILAMSPIPPPTPLLLPRYIIDTAQVCAVVRLQRRQGNELHQRIQHPRVRPLAQHHLHSTTSNIVTLYEL